MTTQLQIHVVALGALLITVPSEAKAPLVNALSAVSISFPSEDQTVSNVNQGGSTDVAITGSADVPSFTKYVLDYGAGESPSSYTEIRTGRAPVRDGSLGTWATASLSNGIYTLRLRASDKAGKETQAVVNATLSHFRVAQEPIAQMNAGAGNTVAYTSTVPFALEETILIKDLEERVVRTLVRGVSRTAGSYTDRWDGRDDSGNLLRDGPYFYVASAKAGTSSMTWDLTHDTPPPLWLLVGDLTPIDPDPFHNRPAIMPFSFDRPGRLTVRLRPSSVGGPLTDCRPPRYCAVKGEYVESGPRVYSWGGADGDGVIRQDFGFIDVGLDSSLPKNVVILFGTKPTVTKVQVMPSFFFPSNGDQIVSFDLTTYGRQPASVSVGFLSQLSRSALRTMTLPNVQPGVVSTSWDGRGDDGLRVPPGNYTVNVTVTDGLGNQARGQILTTVAY